MYQSALVLLAAITAAQAAPQAADPVCAKPPAKGLEGAMGGLFGMSGAMSGANTPNIGGLLVQGPYTTIPNGPAKKGGTGPYSARYFTDNTLPGHTIYAPKTPPAEELPVLVWGNGGCIASGTSFEVLLTEIASHGFLVLANGAADGVPFLGGFSTPAQLTESVDWVYKGANNGKYGKVNKDKIAVAGQSCGGLESYSAAYHDDRIKFIGIFNSGLLNPAKTCLLKEFKVPIAYFLGGPKDIAFENGERDFGNLPRGLPAIKMSLDAGHMATYYAANAGHFGKAAVAYFKWVLKGDQASKKMYLDNPSPWTKEGWNITVKNWS